VDTSHVPFFIFITLAGLGCVFVLGLVIFTLRTFSTKNGRVRRGSQSLWKSIRKIRTQCPVCGLRFFALSRYCAHCGSRLKDQQASAS
jgi:ribosomal protein L37E